MKQTRSFGLLLALLVLPICDFCAMPPSPLHCSPPAIHFDVGWQLEPYQGKERRPWLNPARAALKA